MELHAVVEAGVGELLEVLDRLGGVLVVEFRGDRAAIGLEGGCLQLASPQGEGQRYSGRGVACHRWSRVHWSTAPRTITLRARRVLRSSHLSSLAGSMRVVIPAVLLALSLACGGEGAHDRAGPAIGTGGGVAHGVGAQRGAAGGRDAHSRRRHPRCVGRGDHRARRRPGRRRIRRSRSVANGVVTGVSPARR